MNSLPTHRILSLIALLLLSVLLGALNPAAAQTEPLRVVTKPFPPLVIKQGDAFSGFSIELWDSIAAEIGADYRLIEVASVGDQLAAVQDGDADVAVAGITITEQREEDVDFTYPYFDSGLQIMVKEENTSPIINALNAVLAPEMLQFLAVSILLVLLIAHAVWWFERRKNPHFPRSYGRGITQALWWSAVTALGYDDQPLRSVLGRLLSLLWMFAAIFIIASLTASLSAAATVRQLQSDIRGLSDLPGRRVATVAGTSSASYLQSHGIAYTGAATFDDAVALLLDGRADAVVYDSPVLRDYIKTSSRGDLGLVGGIFAPERYGIALPTGSPYRETINRAILKLQEDGTYQRLYDRWFSVADN